MYADNKIKLKYGLSENSTYVYFLINYIYQLHLFILKIPH